MARRELSIDLETYSSIDINNGVYKYTEAEDFEVLLMSYTYDRDKSRVRTIDFTKGEKIPVQLYKDLYDGDILKTAYNAAFEITCLNMWLDKPLEVSQWQCTMAKAAQAGYPFGLANVAKVMGCAEQKDDKGKALIRYFSIPCKPTKANGGRKRNLPEHDPQKWADYVAYNRQDVATEIDVLSGLDWFKIPLKERLMWQLDQDINRRGVKADMRLVLNAIDIYDHHMKSVTEELKELTGLENPRSQPQFKSWLCRECPEVRVEGLAKEVLEELKDEYAEEGRADLVEAIELRAELTKTSIKKYHSIRESVCADGRVRGLFQYYGARTGRWAGRNVQLHNLKKNELEGEELDLARDAVLRGDYGVLRLMFGRNVCWVLSNLIRTAFVGNLIAPDFSAIEARVLSWMAGEEWVLNIFKGHGKLYEATASQMYKVGIDKVDKEMRAKGKIATLACGYQGWIGALKKMGGEKMGLSEEEMKDIVQKWRQSNPNIVKLWKLYEETAKKVIRASDGAVVYSVGKVKFSKWKGNMHITLPSGRSLIYQKVRIVDEQIVYKSKGADEALEGGRGKRRLKEGDIAGLWVDVESYGGKLCENICQGIARDILAEKMLAVAGMGFKIVMHVHDEIVIDFRSHKMTVGRAAELINEELGRGIEWAKGLPLKAEASVGNYYKK